jgi:cysteine desulfurase
MRLPNSASFVLEGVDGTSLIAALDMAGFSVSSGSACTSGDTEPSHVILALGIDRELAKGSLRVTVGRSTTDADVEAFLAALPGVVARVRGAAPVSA